MQAIIYQIEPFDAEQGTTIRFNWHGSQVFKNRCIIQKNESGEQVYDQTIVSFKLEHPIDPAQANLENGTKYNAFIIVYDHDNTPSDIQPIGQPFICLKKPVFAFSNLSEGQTMETSALSFNLKYEQEQGELLDSWSITIYNHELSQLATSGVKYETQDLTFSFNGFLSKMEYAARGMGRTVNGIVLDTGYVNFSVVYTVADVFNLIELTNLPRIGAIHVKSNLVVAEGKLDHGELRFVDGEYLDLMDNTLTYSEGFLYKGDFSQVVYFKGTRPNMPVIEMEGTSPAALTVVITPRVVYYTAEITRVDLDGGTPPDAERQEMDAGVVGIPEGTRMLDIDGSGNENGPVRLLRSCFELRATSYHITYIRYSRFLPQIDPEDKVGVCFYRNNGLFDIEAINFSKEGGEG